MTTVYVGGEKHVLVLSSKADAFVVQQAISVGPAPSFLCFAPDRQRAYVAVEGADALASFRVDDDGALTLLATTPCPGGPAYVSVDRSQNWVLAASYGSGQLHVFGMDDQGVLTPARQSLKTGEWSHAALVDPENRRIFVPSKGTDRIAVLAFDASTGSVTPHSTIDTPAGSGPRHVAFSSNGRWLYVVDENDCTLLVLERGAAGHALIQTASTLPRDFAPGDSGADIHLSADERFLYVSNRGHDNLAVFSCDAGAVRLVGTTPSGGRVPRNFCFLGNERLLVANQESHSLALFARHPDDGSLTLLGTHQLEERIFWVGPVNAPGAP